MKKFIFLLFILLISFFITPVMSIEQEVKFKGTKEEMNGVKIIKNPARPLYGEIKLDLQKDLVIGNDNDENYTLYRVWDIKADDRGNIYVLDSGAYRIQKYDREGKYLRTTGMS